MIDVILKCMRTKLHADRHEREAFRLFSEAARRGGPELTQDQIDMAWHELQKKADRDFAAEIAAGKP